MTLTEYLQLKAARAAQVRTPRPRCSQCKKPPQTCYCKELLPFASSVQFVILMHPTESKRSIATGRMAHLSLSNSRLFVGQDFSEHAEVNAILENPNYHCVVLWPKGKSTNLTALSSAQRKALFPKNKQLILFVIDGTWAQALRMVRASQNLSQLPRIHFEPDEPSRFLVRQQPEANCYSTIEAIHICLGLLGENTRADSLLKPFAFLVNQQIEYEIWNSKILYSGS